MNSIKILGSGVCIPKKEVLNCDLATRFNISSQYIYERTGIEKRFFVENETIVNLAINAVNDVFSKIEFDKRKIDLIIVASTSTNKLMPGISYLVQKELQIDKCMCMDILAGCSGYINAFDIARNYITLGKANYALVIGCEVLSNYIDKNDLGTAIILADGAGATLIGKTEDKKIYDSLLESNGMKSEILTCTANEKIKMDGKSVYKFAITDTVHNVKEILKNNNLTLNDIKYIVPHQSNIRIIQSIAERLSVSKEKIYTNISEVGNTFCASIPIALNEMIEKGRLQKNDRIILLGYGGGLNLGSILLEI